MPIKSNGNGFVLSNGKLQKHLEEHTGLEGETALDVFLGFTEEDLGRFVDYAMANDRQLLGANRSFVYASVKERQSHAIKEYGKV
ncbi:MAG: hypothetical protein CMH64_00675 [Nanoarchaeota archaeon]|nr:hypothetical protein [Nanoarchaeota archaeon]|tara:strand:- start:567 stop:821 length:255 start_codon:yes stop_codon:yes gene_type:complete